MQSVEFCYNVAFPIPWPDRSQWTEGQRWFHEKQKELNNDNFFVSWDEEVVAGEAWLFSASAEVEHVHGAALIFGANPRVAYARINLVAPFVQLKDEYDGWEKTIFQPDRACSESQTIHGSVQGCSCVFKVYPFQLSRLQRLLDAKVVDRMDSFLGAHLRYCISACNK